MKNLLNKIADASESDFVWGVFCYALLIVIAILGMAVCVYGDQTVEVVIPTDENQQTQIDTLESLTNTLSIQIIDLQERVSALENIPDPDLDPIAPDPAPERVLIDASSFTALIHSGAVIENYELTEEVKFNNKSETLNVTINNCVFKGISIRSTAGSRDANGNFIDAVDRTEESFAYRYWTWNDCTFANAYNPTWLGRQQGLFIEGCFGHTFNDCVLDNNGHHERGRYDQNQNAYVVDSAALQFIGGRNTRAAHSGFKIRGVADGVINGVTVPGLLISGMYFENNIADIQFDDDRPFDTVIIDRNIFKNTGGIKQRGISLAWSIDCTMKGEENVGKHVIVANNTWIGPNDIPYTSGWYVANFYGPNLRKVVMSNNDASAWSPIDTKGVVRNNIGNRLKLENNIGF